MDRKEYLRRRNEAKYSDERVCDECGKRIQNKNISGFCKQCMNKGERNPSKLLKTRIKMSQAKLGKRSNQWKGGSESYYRVQARKIVSEYFDLQPMNEVHHKDENIRNNEIENLAVFEIHGDHTSHHKSVYKEGAKPIWDGNIIEGR